MGFRKKTISAFSDGSDDDNEYFETMARERRFKTDANQAVDVILNYLDQCIDVLERDAKRHRNAHDFDRYEETKERIAWCEAMKIWINRNV